MPCSVLRKPPAEAQTREERSLEPRARQVEGDWHEQRHRRTEAEHAVERIRERRQVQGDRCGQRRRRQPPRSPPVAGESAEDDDEHHRVERAEELPGELRAGETSAEEPVQRIVQKRDADSVKELEVDPRPKTALIRRSAL